VPADTGLILGMFPVNRKKIS